MASGADDILYLDLSVNSQNEAANTSSIHWKVRFYCGYGVNATQSGTAYVNGILVWSYGSANPGAYTFGNTYTVAQGDITLTHDASGILSVSGTAHLQTNPTSGYTWCFVKDATGSCAVSRLTHAPGAPTGYSARSITSSDAYTTGISVPDAGRATLTDIQVEWNTSQSDTGASFATGGGWADPHMTGLYRGTTYQFRVRVANDTNGWGAWGVWTSFTTSSLPASAPGMPVFTNVLPTSLTVSWAASGDNGGAGIDGYLLRYWPNAEGTGAYVDVSQTNDLGRAVSGLTPGTFYRFVVYAHNAAGYSPASAPNVVQMLAGAWIKVAGVWKLAIPYVKVAGEWKLAVPYIKVAGVWKMTS